MKPSISTHHVGFKENAVVWTNRESPFDVVEVPVTNMAEKEKESGLRWLLGGWFHRKEGTVIINTPYVG